MAQQYDSAAKYVMLEHPQALAKLVFGDQEVEMLGARNTEQRIFAERRNDSTHKVQFPDRRAILHTEVQAYDSTTPMLFRVAAYHGYLLSEYKMPVYCCVIYLHPNAGRTDPSHYEYEWNGCKYLIQYKVIRLIEIEGQPILDAQDPGLLPFTPLMKRREGMSANRWLDECIDATKSVPLDAPRRDVLLSVLGIFGSLVYDYEYIKQRIPEGIMLESPLVQHYIQEAKTQGIEQGETRAKQAAVLKLLRLRFDPVPESVTEKIALIQSRSHLDSLLEQALTAQKPDDIDLENHDS